MSATAIAKANTQLFKRIMGSLNDANIVLIVINHITSKIEINAFAKTQADVNYLKQDEQLPGGKAPVFLSNHVIKLITSEKLSPDKDFGIKGFKVIGEFIKSRSATAGISFTSVFDQVNGFDNILSNYLLLKDNKIIKGAGRGFYLPNCEDIKFTQKDFKQKYLENPTLKEAFDALVEEELIKFIPTPKKLSEKIFDGESDEELVFDEESGYYKDSEGNFYDEEGNLLEE